MFCYEEVIGVKYQNIKSAKKVWHILWGCHQNWISGQWKAKGDNQKKGSIKACEFDCCIKNTRDRQHVCLCTNLFNKAKSSIAHDRQ